jgi:hypothetical protein
LLAHCYDFQVTVLFFGPFGRGLWLLFFLWGELLLLRGLNGGFFFRRERLFFLRGLLLKGLFLRGLLLKGLFLRGLVLRGLLFKGLFLRGLFLRNLLFFFRDIVIFLRRGFASPL